MVILGYTFLSGENSLLSSAVSSGDITYVSAQGAQIDNMYVSLDTTVDPLAPLPSNWGAKTVLYAKYDINLHASNIDYITSTVDHILIKRREQGTLSWITIDAIEITDKNDFLVNGVDVMARSRQEYEYALVPVYQGIEGTYCISSVYSLFNGLFVLEKGAMFGTIINPKCDVTRNAPSSVVEMLNSVKPKYVSNSIANYDTGTASGEFLHIVGCENGDVNGFDLYKGWNWRKSFLDFLTDRKPKILKYETGAIWLVNITGAPTNNSIDDNIMERRQISFEWAEVGNYESEKDLYYAGLSTVPQEWWTNNS